MNSYSKIDKELLAAEDINVLYRSLTHTSVVEILSGMSKIRPGLFLGSGQNDLYEQ